MFPYVLLIEQDSAVRRFTRRVLQKNGFHVYEVPDLKNARQAVEFYPEPFRLIVVDVFVSASLQLEEFDSFAKEKNIPFTLYLSTMPDPYLYEKGILKPTHHFLVKPFSPKELMDKINEVLGLPFQS